MSPRTGAITACILLAVSPWSALATSITVPDEMPTVQSALDARYCCSSPAQGADTILIRSGFYDESPRGLQGVTIIGIGPARPRLKGLSLSNEDGSFYSAQTWIIRGIDVQDTVRLTVNGWDFFYLNRITFSDCRLDGGVRASGTWDVDDIERFEVINCRLSGPISAAALFVRIEDDTLSAGLNLFAAWDLSIRRCRFTGGPGTAIEVIGETNLWGTIAENQIEGYDVGIGGRDMNGLVIEDNQIHACGTGLALRGAWFNPMVVRRNLVTDCNAGIDANTDDASFRQNRVLRSTTFGMRIDNYTPLVVEGNVVGGCGGNGLVLGRAYNGARIANNTIYGNGGTGIEIMDPPFFGAIDIARNIVAGNSGWGISTAVPATLDCNDWFDNDVGATNGISSGATDVSVDPRFCDVAHSDVGLRTDSPLLHLPCDSIGASRAVCGVTPVLAALRASAIGEGIEIEWRWSGPERPNESWVERAEKAEGPWTRCMTERRTQGESFVELDRSIVRGRTYHYRLAWHLGDGGFGHSSEISVITQDELAFGFRSITPNPASGPIHVDWVVPGAESVELAVFDVLGRNVARLAGGCAEPGPHRSTWTPSSGTSPGLYFVRLRQANRTAIVRLLLRR